MRNDKIKGVYESTLKLLRDKASVFKKKHGNYLVLYAPHNQVVVMDTWNGHIWQGHTTEPIEDDGYAPETVLAHTSMYSLNGEYFGEMEQALELYKTVLSI